MKIAGTILAVLLVAATPLFAAPAMQEGKWEISVKMDMPGMPFPMPPMVTTHCYSKEDVKDTTKTLPSSSKKKDDCEVKDMKVNGNKVTWKMQCKDGTKGHGEAEYKKSSYTSVLTLETKDKKNGTSTVVQHISAKRVGDCK
jgi:hypothetical protein